MRPSAAFWSTTTFVRQRQLLAVRDEGFEALDEKDDVDLIALLVADGRPVAGPDYGTTRPISASRGPRRGPFGRRRDHGGHVAAEAPRSP